MSLVGGGDEQGGDGEHVVRAVPLAGRRQLCINEKVSQSAYALQCELMMTSGDRSERLAGRRAMIE